MKTTMDNTIHKQTNIDDDISMSSPQTIKIFDILKIVIYFSISSTSTWYIPGYEQLVDHEMMMMT